MSRQKLPMNRIFVDELFMLNQNKSSGLYHHPEKHHIKLPNNLANQIKNMTIQDRRDMLTKKTYNNIKAFKHSNSQLQRTLKNLKLSNLTINPGNVSFQNQELFAINAPESYKAFPKRESPLKNNNPAKFFMATQTKKSSQKQLQQSSILQTNSKRFILTSSSFSNSRQINDNRKVKMLYSQRRNNIYTIDHDLSTESIVLQQTISLKRPPKQKSKKISIKGLKRPKTSVYSNKYANHYRKDNIEPWQSYIQYDQSDVEQISHKN